jgi:peptidyl-prolyl cis-trans isomerase C
MRISYKLITLMVCAMIGTSYGAAKPAKDATMKVKDANVPAKKAEAVKKTEIAPAPKAASASPEKASEQPKPAASETIKSGVAATVNGGNITEEEIDAKIKPVLDRRARQMDPNMVEQYKKRLRPQVLDAIIVERLLDEQVKKNNVTVTEADVNDKIGEMLKQQGMSQDMFKSLLTAQGQSYDQFEQQMKKAIGYEKLLALQARPIEVNEAEVTAYYEENKDSFKEPEEVNASHILIKVAASATPEEKAAAKEKAEKLLKQVREGGDFAELARENSDCPSKAQGGNLGFFAKGQMVPEFEKAAFGMQPGQVSDVVETQFGYHIIKVIDRKEANVTSFEKARPDIVKGLQQMKQSKAFKQYVEKLKAGATIVYAEGQEPKKEPIMPRTMEVSPSPK